MNIDPADRPKFSDYEDSFVAFVDLLGFTEVVRAIKSGRDFDRLGLLLFALKKEAEAYSAADGHLTEVTATAVSDSIVFTVPFSAPAAAMKFIAMLHYLQYNLIATFQAPLRGFVSRGSVYHQDGILFGTGYLDAYNGEVSIKGPPRIVVDHQIIAAARNVIDAQQSLDGKVSIFTYLVEDEDGNFFIDYLKPVGAVGNNPDIDIRAEHEAIREFAAQRVQHFEHNEKIRSKYEWLLAYCDRRRTEVGCPY